MIPNHKPNECLICVSNDRKKSRIDSNEDTPRWWQILRYIAIKQPAYKELSGSGEWTRKKLLLTLYQHGLVAIKSTGFVLTIGGLEKVKEVFPQESALKIIKILVTDDADVEFANSKHISVVETVMGRARGFYNQQPAIQTTSKAIAVENKKDSSVKTKTRNPRIVDKNSKLVRYFEQLAYRGCSYQELYDYLRAENLFVNVKASQKMMSRLTLAKQVFKHKDRFYASTVDLNKLLVLNSLTSSNGNQSYSSNGNGSYEDSNMTANFDNEKTVDTDRFSQPFKSFSHSLSSESDRHKKQQSERCFA